MPADESVQRYWEQRLAQDWTVRGVGYRALGRPFNTWMYRVRREVFLRESRALDIDLATADVLDVGSGTGFYVALWQQLGARSVSGADFTRSAVDNLQQRFPGLRFHQVDVSERLPEGLEPSAFDVVSCIDMLFHIVDDERYRAAVENFARLLRPGGYFLFSENFLHGVEQRGPHQVNRTLATIEGLLRAAGFDVARRVPMLVLMNSQVDAPRRWRRAWGGLLRAATVVPATGWLAGALLYPLERRLVRRRTESPTTELMVCRRRA